MNTALKHDPSIKNFLLHKERCADIINAFLFHGEPVIHANDLQYWDCEASVVIDLDTFVTSLNRTRDMMMKVNVNGFEFLLGIENQFYVDKNIPYRIYEYNYTTYHRQKKVNDSLMPVVTIVLYYGEYKWTGGYCLFDDVPVPFQPFVDEQQTFLFDMKEVDYHIMKNKENRDLIEGLQRIYALHDMESLKHMNVHRDVAIILSTIVHNDELLRIVKTEKGEVINMCTSLDRLVEESKSIGRSEGREEGRKEGRNEGISIGEERGIIQGKTSTLLTLLKSQLNSISNDTTTLLENSSSEQLDLIIHHFSHIHNENDIRNLLACS